MVSSTFFVVVPFLKKALHIIHLAREECRQGRRRIDVNQTSILEAFIYFFGFRFQVDFWVFHMPKYLDICLATDFKKMLLPSIMTLFNFRLKPDRFLCKFSACWEVKSMPMVLSLGSSSIKLEFFTVVDHSKAIISTVFVLHCVVKEVKRSWKHLKEAKHLN